MYSHIGCCGAGADDTKICSRHFRACSLDIWEEGRISHPQMISHEWWSRIQNFRLGLVTMFFPTSSHISQNLGFLALDIYGKHEREVVYCRQGRRELSTSINDSTSSKEYRGSNKEVDTDWANWIEFPSNYQCHWVSIGCASALCWLFI